MFVAEPIVRPLLAEGDLHAVFLKFTRHMLLRQPYLKIASSPSHHFYVVNFCKTPYVQVDYDDRCRVGSVRARGPDAVVVHLFSENRVEDLLFFLAIVDLLSSRGLPQRP